MTGKKGNQPVPGNAALADTAVHHHDGDFLAVGDAQEIRPDFCFDEDDDFRIDNIEMRPVRYGRSRKNTDAVCPVYASGEPCGTLSP